MKTTSNTSSIAGSVARASPSTSSADCSSPASAMLRRQASILRGSCSRERTRPPRWRTPAASQIVEYPREPPISSTSQSACGATSEKRNLPVVGATWRLRSSGGSPRSRSSASSRSRRSSAARTRSSSTGGEHMLPRVRAELTIEIARPRDDVFAYLTDVSNLPSWQSGVHRAEIEEGGEARTGVHIRESRHLLGRELSTRLEIAELERPRLFCLRALESPVPFTVRHELEPAEGGTKLTVVGEGDAGMLPGFASGIMARRAKRQFRKDFERLKKILES